MKKNTIFKNKRVLITGHTGFKGSWLANWIKLLGGKVIGFSLDVPTSPSQYELIKNSLFKDQSGAKQDTIKDFCKKIELIKKTRNYKDFLIGARIESFILGKGLKDALKRAEAYSKAGADIILIHSKNKTPKEIFSFSKIFKKSKNFKPLVAVPSTYYKTTEKMLIENGFKIVIYANHMLRASYPAMKKAAQNILKSQRSYEIEKKISSVDEVINLIK